MQPWIGARDPTILCNVCYICMVKIQVTFQIAPNVIDRRVCCTTYMLVCRVPFFSVSQEGSVIARVQVIACWTHILLWVNKRHCKCLITIHILHNVCCREGGILDTIKAGPLCNGWAECAYFVEHMVLNYITTRSNCKANSYSQCPKPNEFCIIISSFISLLQGQIDFVKPRVIWHNQR